MKQQLIQIEAKLDRLLTQQILGKNSQKDIQFEQKDIEIEKEEPLPIREDEQENEETFFLGESSFLEKEITDDTDPFEDEEKISNKQPKNKETALPKITVNDQEKFIMIPDEKGAVKAPIKTIEDYMSLIQDILSDKFAIKNSTKQALLQILRDRFKTLKQSSEQKSNSLNQAKSLFQKESYENAISEFQKYRDNNPKGEHYPEATFYIGQSFKHLQMPAEAEIFFKEIVQTYPESLWAGRAKKFLEE